MAIFVIVIATLNLIYGLTSYRYQDTGISSHQHLLILLFGILLQNVVLMDLLYLSFCRANKNAQPLNGRTSFENKLLGVGLILLSNGVESVFFGLNAALFCFFPTVFRKIFFAKKVQKVSGRAAKLCAALIIEIIVFTLAYHIGNAVKLSANGRSLVAAYNDFESFHRTQRAHIRQHSQRYLTKKTHKISTTFVGKLKTSLDKNFLTLKYFLYYFIARVSTYYYSFVFTTAVPRGTFFRYGAPVTIPLRTALFRADRLMGGVFGFRKSKVSTISHLNYYLLLNDNARVRTRSGTSPGLLASFNYLFKFPFNILLCVLYLCCFSKIFDTLFECPHFEVVTLGGICVIFTYVQFLFQTPFDFLLIFSTNFIRLMAAISFFILKRGDLFYAEVGNGEAVMTKVIA